MKVILELDEAVLDKIISAVVCDLKSQLNLDSQADWISQEETMLRTGVSSRTTLKKYTDLGILETSRPGKITLYKRTSVEALMQDKSSNNNLL